MRQQKPRPDATDRMNGNIAPSRFGLALPVVTSSAVCDMCGETGVDRLPRGASIPALVGTQAGADAHLVIAVTPRT
jgi:hypothetical protein